MVHKHLRGGGTSSLFEVEAGYQGLIEAASGTEGVQREWGRRLLTRYENENCYYTDDIYQRL